MRALQNYTTDALRIRYETGLRTRYGCATDALHMRYGYATHALQIRYECATDTLRDWTMDTLRMRYEWIKISNNVFQKIGVFHSIRRAVVFRARCYQD